VTAIARRFDPWTQRPQIEAIWAALAAAARPSYFLSWAWVENWLATLPRRVTLQLIALEEAAGPIAAWFVGERVILLGGLVPSRTRFLNATGWEEFDQLTIEHNGWLVRPGAACPIDRVVAELGRGWDELVLPGMDAAVAQLTPSHLGAVMVRKAVACPVVDLARVRESGDYLALLGGDTRSQIRRAEKLYAARGAISIELATDVSHATAIFDELIELHTAAWRARGEPGAFSPYMRTFHARLIANRLPRGEIQLVRVRAGGATIGCLYNFVSDGVVSFYQSGVAYEADNKLKPGLVCHAQAVRWNAAAGHRTYDFLGGDARYKQSLATGATRLTWCTIRRPRLRFALEDRARGLVRRWRQWRHAQAREERA
jgi:CelD/BcsL family acetyltransferase involved in cellulose biosynthesis